MFLGQSPYYRIMSLSRHSEISVWYWPLSKSVQRSIYLIYVFILILLFYLCMYTMFKQINILTYLLTTLIEQFLHMYVYFAYLRSQTHLSENLCFLGLCSFNCFSITNAILYKIKLVRPGHPDNKTFFFISVWMSWRQRYPCRYT